MRRPFEEITESTLRNLEKVRENQIRNFLNFEKFIIWIVAFSIGGISLLISNFNDINQKFPKTTVSIILFFLGMSSILGIIRRFCFYKYQTFYQNAEIFIENSFRKNEMMQIESFDIDIVDDVDQIINKLKDDFNLDYSYVRSTFSTFDELNQNIIKNNLRRNYKVYSESVQDQYAFTLNYVKRVLSLAFGKSENEMNKILNRNNARYFDIYGYLTNFCSISSLLFFLLTIIFVIFGL